MPVLAAPLMQGQGGLHMTALVVLATPGQEVVATEVQVRAPHVPEFAPVNNLFRCVSWR